MIARTVARLRAMGQAGIGVSVRWFAEGKAGKRQGESGINEGKGLEKPLWQILRGSKDVLQGSGEIRECILLCRSITRHYSYQRREDFKNCKEEIQKLIDTLSSLPLSDLSLDHIFAILDFLAAVLKSQQIKKEVIGNFKDLLFMHLQPTVKNASALSLQQLGNLYAKLAPFNYPDLSQLANLLESYLNKLEYRLDLPIVESIFMGLHQRKFLSFSDGKILRLVLKELQGYSSQTPPICLAKILHVIESMSLRTLFGDSSSLASIEHLQESFLLHVNSASIDDASISYMITTPYKNIEKSKIREAIFVKIIKSIKKGEVNAVIIPRLISCLRNKGDLQVNEQQSEVIAEYIVHCSQDKRKKVAFSTIDQQNVLLQLFSLISFEYSLSKLEEMIIKDDFQLHWSLVAAYSLKNCKFPLRKLEAKIKPRTSELSLDGTYIKAALSIGIQHQLHKDSVILKQSYEAILTSLKGCDWNEKHLQWLGRETHINSEIMQVFHRLYHHTYFQRFDPIKLSGVSLGRYYDYIASNFHQHHCNGTLVSSFPLKQLQSCILRELGNQGPMNAFLLYLIDYFVQKNAITFESNLMILSVRLLLHYSGQFSTSQQGLHLYQSIMVFLNDSYPKMNHLTQQINHILKRMVACSPDSLYYYSFSYGFFLNEMMKSIERVKDVDLLVMIIRTALNKNILRIRHLTNLRFPLDYFDKIEQQRLANITKNVAFDVSKPELLSFEDLQYVLLCLNKPVKGDAVNQRLFEQYIDRLSHECNFPALMRKENFMGTGTLASKFFSKITSSQIKDFLLHDHLSLVGIIIKYGLKDQKYISRLYQYLSNHYPAMKSSQTFIQLYCKAPLFNIQLDSSHLKDIFSLQSTDPRPQLRLIALMSGRLDKSIAAKIVANLVRNSVASLQRNYYNWFVNLNYKVDMKLVNVVDKKEKWGRQANVLEARAAAILKENGQKVVEEKINNDTAYLIGSKAIVFLAQYHPPPTLQILRQFLSLKYPKLIVEIVSQGSKEQLLSMINKCQGKGILKQKTLASLKHALLH